MEEALRVKKSIELNPESTRMLFGTNDRYIKQLEEELAVDVTDRDGAIQIIGSEKNTASVLRHLTFISAVDIIASRYIDYRYIEQRAR